MADSPAKRSPARQRSFVAERLLGGTPDRQEADPVHWDVEHVLEWLRGVWGRRETDKHAAGFRRERIDGEKLLHLTYPREGAGLFAAIGVTDKDHVAEITEAVEALFSQGLDEEVSAADAAAQQAANERMLKNDAEFAAMDARERRLKAKMKRDSVKSTRELFDNIANVRDDDQLASPEHRASFSALMATSTRQDTAEAAELRRIRELKLEKVDATDELITHLHDVKIRNLAALNETPEVRAMNAEIEAAGGGGDDSDEEAERREAEVRRLRAERKAKKTAAAAALHGDDVAAKEEAARIEAAQQARSKAEAEVAAARAEKEAVAAAAAAGAEGAAAASPSAAVAGPGYEGEGEGETAEKPKGCCVLL